jgi:hypothetical protein
MCERKGLKTKIRIWERREQEENKGIGKGREQKER